MPMPDDYEGSESSATGWALDQLIGRLGNIYTRFNLSPPKALRDAAKGWVSLSQDEIVRVVEDHLREHSRPYTCGSGDGHFYLVQAAIRRAMEAKYPRGHFDDEPERPRRRRLGRDRKVYNAAGGLPM
jgi:hypothetical protein